MLFAAALTLEIIKSGKHSMGKGGPSLRRCSGWCGKRVACGHLNPGDMWWYSGSSAFTEDRERPKIVPLAPELLVPGGQHETVRCRRPPWMLESGEAVLQSRETGLENWPHLMSSPQFSLLIVLWPRLLEEHYSLCVFSFLPCN